nr:MAG TPA: hypothetical protein [Caudoviricetes sp.]
MQTSLHESANISARECKHLCTRVPTNPLSRTP